MANKIPCPNPACAHEFSQAELQAAAQLVCPKCGFRMQGKAAPPSPPRPAVAAPIKPAAAAKPVPPLATPIKPAAAPPLAQPIPASPPKIAPALPIAAPPASAPPNSDNPFAFPSGPAKPAAKPAAAPLPPPSAPAAAPGNAEESLPPGTFFNPEIPAGAGSIVRTSRPKRKFNWMRLAIIVCSIGFAVSLVVIAVVSTLWFLLGTEGFGGLAAETPDGSVFWHNIRGPNGPEKAFKLVLPRDIWEVDKEIQSRFEVKEAQGRLDAIAAWKRKDDDLWFAVLVKDYGMQKPRDAAVLKIAVDRLEGHFGDALELQAKAEPDKFGDLPAQKLQFKGQMNSANWLGDCWMFFKDGIAYWVFIASPEWQKVADFEDEMPNKRIYPTVERRGWREQPWPTESFKSEDGKIAMSAPKGVWERHDAKTEDQNGLLFLFGKYAAEKDNRKNAQLQVFTFEKKDDLKSALAYAREYLEKKDDNENKNFKIALADDMVKGQTDAGTAQPVGDRPGRVIDLKRLFDGEPKRYFLLAVINDPDTAYAIVCECTWESRQIWRSDFMDIIGTLRIKK